MNPFTALDSDWNLVAAGPPARRAMRAWAESIPSLAGHDSPADLVTDIGRMGDPERSCRLLAHLLVLAGGDALAARAVLQAVTPGLRRAAVRRWRTASGNGPWPIYDDIAADTISAAREAIQARSGEHHDHPARIIVRFAEGRLRRTHDNWRATNTDLTELTNETQLSQSAIDAALGIEQQALTVITDALQARIIGHHSASISAAAARAAASSTMALPWA